MAEAPHTSDPARVEAFGLAFVNVWASLGVHAALAALYLLPEHAHLRRRSHT
jgi:hypothetical protein